jgi:HSP20 family protein
MNGLIRWNRPDLTTWPAFGRLTDLRDEIDRLFESPLSELARGSQLLSGWTPALDLYEDKDNFVVKAELPGMKKEDIEVSMHEGSLSISGERKSEEKHKDADVYRTERFFGRFQRTVALPTPVAADKVKASYKDGVLTITLPKTEEAKPKQIEVNVS